MAALLAFAPCFASEANETPFYDIIVYGATSGGVISAYAASQMGASVLIVEPGRHAGGLSSGGLGWTDKGKSDSIFGLSRDFYRRISEYYGNEGFQRNFEPHVAERIFEAYLDEADIEVWYSRRVASVSKRANQIAEIELEYTGNARKPRPNLKIRGKVYIDASYEGDLMARAGVSYTTGRESNAQYGESLNGVQYPKAVGEHRNPNRRKEWPVGVDPYRIPGEPDSGLLEGVSDAPLLPLGTGDDLIQAYNFRMCLCQGENAVPFSKPEAYRPERYELLLRYQDVKPWTEFTLRNLFLINRMPNGKTDWNNNGSAGLSTDYIGGSQEYPDADYEQRDAIWQDHVNYQKGLLWFLATDERIPHHIREELNTWGYCRDEFLDTDGWPHALYVREARRMVGQYVMTEKNVTGAERVSDGIAFGSYAIDSHNTQRIVVDGMVGNEGNVTVFDHGWPDFDFTPYPVSYRSITPIQEEAGNLLVTFALSASHIAFGSIRMEPVFMMTGQGAGIAAAIAAAEGIDVQEVAASKIQQFLESNPLMGRPPPEVERDLFFPDFP